MTSVVSSAYLRNIVLTFLIGLAAIQNVWAQCFANQDWYSPYDFPELPAYGGKYKDIAEALSVAKHVFLGPGGVYEAPSAADACKGRYLSATLALVPGGGAGAYPYEGGTLVLADYPSNTYFIVFDYDRAICDYGVIISVQHRTYTNLAAVTCTTPAAPLDLTFTGPTETRPAATGGTSAVNVVAKVTVAGAPKSGVGLGFSAEVTPNSGGHDHDNTARPKGTLSMAQGTTDANGEVKVTFTAPEIAGIHIVRATCTTCSNTVVTKEIQVKVPDLVPIFSVAMRDAQWAYPGIGQVTGRHAENHYLTTSAMTRMLDIARKYKAIWPNAPKLTLNDASLIWGGKFDIPGTWSANPRAHAEHRLGANVDVRANSASGAVPENIREAVYLWLRNSSRRQDNISPEFAIESVNPLWESPGTQNEHFHLRLGN